jgi:hypothetical protein
MRQREVGTSREAPRDASARGRDVSGGLPRCVGVAPGRGDPSFANRGAGAAMTRAGVGSSRDRVAASRRPTEPARYHLAVNTKVLLTLSAAVLGAAGIAGLFLPQEILGALGIVPAGVLVLTVIVQLLAALLFAGAIMNWTARGSLIGGIYNRPVAIANLTHFMIGALTVTKAFLAAHHSPILGTCAVVYVVFAIAFAMVFFGSPVREPQSGNA